MAKHREKSPELKINSYLSKRWVFTSCWGGIVILILGGGLIYNLQLTSSGFHIARKISSGKDASEKKSLEQIVNNVRNGSNGKHNSKDDLTTLASNGLASDSSKGGGTGTFTDELNQWLSSISMRDDLLKPAKAIQLFESLSGEYDRLITMQGKVVLRVDGGEPMFSGNYFVQLEDVVSAVPRTDPWRYNIRVCDSENGMNILANTKLHGWEKLPAWVETNGKLQETTPSEVLAELPYMIVSPLSTIRMPKENVNEFFGGVIQSIHKTSSEEEKGLTGGPFWVFDRVDSQYWLSETGELKRLAVARRFSDGSGGFDVDKTYDEYQEVNGIRYPKKISLKIKAVGTGGVDYVKKLTGKAKSEALVEVTLPELRVNDSISSKWFENKVK